MQTSKSQIDTERVSAKIRDRVLDLESRKIKITNFVGSDQEKDLSVPPNCCGFGRIRHFRRVANREWPENPLPIDPAHKALGISEKNLCLAQAFQLSACNWKCWYCFVDYRLLSANSRYAVWLTTDELVDLYLGEPDRPHVIVLTGGHPDLVPEWVPWMMQSLINHRLDQTTYLWSDDNLSTDYTWKYLKDNDIQMIQAYRNYGRVCCFKGFDEISFSYNTGAPPSDFRRQFANLRRLLTLGIDVYGYVTLTTPDVNRLRDKIARFLDQLQDLAPLLPLRIVPLEIKAFLTNNRRLSTIPSYVLANQYLAVLAWREELRRKFSDQELLLHVTDVDLYQRL